MTPEKARYNESWGLAPGACNCHHGSARMCPIHTQADYDSSRPNRDAIREKAIAFGVHDAADLLRGWGYPDLADRMRSEAVTRYAALVQHTEEPAKVPLLEGTDGGAHLTSNGYRPPVQHTEEGHPEPCVYCEGEACARCAGAPGCEHGTDERHGTWRRNDPERG